MAALPVARCPPRASSCAWLETKPQRRSFALLVCASRASRPPPTAAPFETASAAAAGSCICSIVASPSAFEAAGCSCCCALETNELYSSDAPSAPCRLRSRWWECARS
eukprot:3237093-Prymnesium_polylepis.2